VADHSGKADGATFSADVTVRRNNFGFLGEKTMNSHVISMAITAGLFWGAVVGGIHRWAGRKAPNANERSFKWGAATALIMAIGYYLVHGIGG
jgi:hypothetical protein